MCPPPQEDLNRGKVEVGGDRGQLSGSVWLDCPIEEVVAACVEPARGLCDRDLGDAPEVHIHADPLARATVVPAHVHHIVFGVYRGAAGG